MDFGRAKPPKDNFCTNSNLIWELPISGNAIKVLGFLKAQAFGYKASLREIARRTVMSVNAVRRSLIQLEEYELIHGEKYTGFHTKYSFAPDWHYEKLIKEHRDAEEMTVETVIRFPPLTTWGLFQVPRSAKDDRLSLIFSTA